MSKKLPIFSRVFLPLLFGLVLVFAIPCPSYAQESFSGIAHDVPILDKSVADGSIVSFTSSGFFLSKTPYDPKAIGVVNENAGIHISIQTALKTYPVISSGNAYVNVSTVNGTIKKGDAITTSSIPGVGMKADRKGIIVGIALEDYTEKDPKKVQAIAVSISLHYASGLTGLGNSLFDIFRLSSVIASEQPNIFFKYLVAGSILLISFILGFISFGRIANTGIEALGRNPLASRMIQIGIVFNVSITIVIIAAGFGLAILVLRL